MLNKAGVLILGGILILGRCVSHVIFTFHSVFLSLDCMEHLNSGSDFELQEVVCRCSNAKKQMELTSTLK